MQPMMVQEGMELSEDSLPDTTPEQVASEVTYNDYLNQLDKENDCPSDIMHHHQFASADNMGGSWINGAGSHNLGSNNLQRDTYMWKIIQKRDRPGNPFVCANGLRGEASTSQQVNTLNKTAYVQNWAMMQNFFHWDNPLPAPKKPRLEDINLNIDLNLSLSIGSQAETREMEVIEPIRFVKDFPHQWYNDESSSNIVADTNETNMVATAKTIPTDTNLKDGS